jgi:hypothetical protein
MNTLRLLPRAAARQTARSLVKTTTPKAFSTSSPFRLAQSPLAPPASSQQPPESYLGTGARVPEFSLASKVVLVSGAGRGLGLVQAEALLEAGAIVYALDRLDEPSPDFARIQKRAEGELQTRLEYRRIDVRDTDALNEIVESIGEKEGRLDGLIAAAGIQQETTALDYSAKDAKQVVFFFGVKQ